MGVLFSWQSGGSLGRGQLEAVPSQEAKLSSVPERPQARVCGRRAPADKPRVPRWQPRVCGPGTGRPSLGGFPWGLKLDGIRPGHASGQKLWASWPESHEGEPGMPRLPRSSALPLVGGGGAAILLEAALRFPWL